MRYRWWIAGLVAAWWLWPLPARDPTLGWQAAVSGDGYAVIQRAEQVQHIFELANDGSVRRKIKVTAGLPEDTRVVGSRDGTALVWLRDQRVALARLDQLAEPALFGKRVQRLCAQTASNDEQFGVAFTERDGVVWVVHGPTGAALDADPVSEPMVREPTYCGVASAGDQLALLWRTGDRVFLVRCGKRCGVALRPDLAASRTILGFGCTRTACVVVTRNPEGTTEASWLDRGANVVWTRPLRDACRDTRVELVGRGDQIAIAYSLGPEPVVTVVGRDGTFHPVWQRGADPDSVPSLAVRGGALLVAAQREGTLVTDVVP